MTSLPPQMQQRLLLSNFYLFYLFFLFTYSQKCGKGSYCLQFLHILSGFYILLQIITYSQIQQGLLVSPMLSNVSFSGGRFSLDVCHIYLHGHTHPWHTALFSGRRYFVSSLILQFVFDIFNIHAAGGWGFGRALSAVCNYWGSLHGLVHPRVLCQVWYLILDNLIFDIWDCIIWYLIYCIYFILSGSSPAQARWGGRVFQVIQELVSDWLCKKVDEHSRPIGNPPLLHLPCVLQVINHETWTKIYVGFLALLLIIFLMFCHSWLHGKVPSQANYYIFEP